MSHPAPPAPADGAVSFSGAGAHVHVAVPRTGARRRGRGVGRGRPPLRPARPRDTRVPRGGGIRGAAVLNPGTESALPDLFKTQAAEPRARALARIVTRRRQYEPLLTSDDFVNAIREALGARSGPSD